MSKPFRGMSKPQMTRLRPDIALIEYSDAGAEEAHLSTNTYALLNAGRMLLLDTNVSSLIPFVRQLSDDGYSPAALVLSLVLSLNYSRIIIYATYYISERCLKVGHGTRKSQSLQ